VDLSVLHAARLREGQIAGGAALHADEGYGG
jgi:hypothetical protein